MYLKYFGKVQFLLTSRNKANQIYFFYIVAFFLVFHFITNDLTHCLKVLRKVFSYKVMILQTWEQQFHVGNVVNGFQFLPSYLLAKQITIHTMQFYTKHSDLIVMPSQTITLAYIYSYKNVHYIYTDLTLFFGEL